MSKQAMQGIWASVALLVVGGAAMAQTAPPTQKSLFREGPCGGILCDTIGGSQAPVHTEPPAPCGGGILCDMMPYAIGAPLGARAQPSYAQAVAAPAPAVAPEPPSVKTRRTVRHRHATTHKHSSASSTN